MVEKIIIIENFENLRVMRYFIKLKGKHSPCPINSAGSQITCNGYRSRNKVQLSPKVGILYKKLGCFHIAINWQMEWIKI